MISLQVDDLLVSYVGVARAEARDLSIESPNRVSDRPERRL